MNTQLSAAYSVCAGIARREAKNFYYAFLALPAPKRRALCAVYAFMRRADDIADDESVAAAERTRVLSEWMARWERAEEGEATDDPIFLALRDTVHRFQIPPARMAELVQGVAMDTEGARSYATFDQLYSYCYYVASVVGLVCIRIFGYRDARAEKLAEETGIAFQLTNIIRDVKEDAEVGRTYLPQEDLQRFGIGDRLAVNQSGELADGSGKAVDSARWKGLLRFEVDRARGYYASARELLPYISADSRPCLRVLVGIYSRLLERVAEHDYDVLTERVRLSGWEKTGILAKGLLGFARA